MTEQDTRLYIAELLTHRCNNCYSALPGPVGCNVHSTGWNWATPNFGPFCDDCIKEIVPGAAVVSRQAFREFASLAAWLENPNESCADRSNPSRIAAAIRGILQAASAVCRCPRCGDVTTEPDAYCAACQKTVTRNIEPAAVSPLALEELDEEFVLDFLAAYYGFENRSVMVTFSDWVGGLADDVKLLRAWASLRRPIADDGADALNHQRIRDEVSRLRAGRHA